MTVLFCLNIYKIYYFYYYYYHYYYIGVCLELASDFPGKKRGKQGEIIIFFVVKRKKVPSQVFILNITIPYSTQGGTGPFPAHRLSWLRRGPSC